jgi:hypothetical protein
MATKIEDAKPEIKTDPPKSIGAEVPTRKPGPADMYDKPWSLNYKRCDYIELPSRAIILDHDNPTFIPRRGKISTEDLNCLFKNALLKKIVPGTIPEPKFDKNVNALQRHIDFLKLRVQLPEVKEYIGNIVNGPSLDGGYEKIDILEAMIAAEEVNPLTRKGGQNRPDVLKELRDAVKYVFSFYGGRISPVSTEVSRPVEKAGDNSGSTEAPARKANPSAVLGL